MVAGLPYIWLSWLHFYCEMFNIILAVTIRFFADLKTSISENVKVLAILGT